MKARFVVLLILLQSSFILYGTEVKRDATNTKVKIKEALLGKPLSEVKPLFGSWIENLKELNQQFLNADPFPYVVIENFFSQEVYEEILKVFPKPIGSHRYRYYNPLEIKNGSVATTTERFDSCSERRKLY